MDTVIFFSFIIILYLKIEDSSMFDDDSKDNRSKPKETLLEWVRKKTTGYVNDQSHFIFLLCEYLSLNINLDLIHRIFFGEIIIY